MGGEPIGTYHHRDVALEEISEVSRSAPIRCAANERHELHFNRLEQYVPICPGLPSVSSSIAIITVAAQRCKPTLAGSRSIAFIKSGSAAFRFFCTIFVCALAINDEADGRASLASLDTTSANAGADRLTARTAAQAANRRNWIFHLHRSFEETSRSRFLPGTGHLQPFRLTEEQDTGIGWNDRE